MGYKYKEDQQIYKKKQDALYSKRGKELIWELKDSPCVDCGIKYSPWIMQFDHRPGEIKYRELARMWKCPVEKILDEIAKCDLVCANCHMDRTYKRRNIV